MVSNSYFVGTLSTPENLNQYKYNGDLPCVMTLKYVIDGFVNPIFVVEAENESCIEFVFLENIESNYSTVIKNKAIISLCSEIMTNYLNENLVLS